MLERLPEIPQKQPWRFEDIGQRWDFGSTAPSQKTGELPNNVITTSRSKKLNLLLFRIFHLTMVLNKSLRSSIWVKIPLKQLFPLVAILSIISSNQTSNLLQQNEHWLLNNVQRVSF